MPVSGGVKSSIGLIFARSPKGVKFGIVALGKEGCPKGGVVSASVQYPENGSWSVWSSPVITITDSKRSCRHRLTLLVHDTGYRRVAQQHAFVQKRTAVR